MATQSTNSTNPTTDLQEIIASSLRTIRTSRDALGLGVRDYPKSTYERWISQAEQTAKEAVISSVRNSWGSLNELRSNISKLFLKNPGLSSLYEDYMHEVLQGVGEQYRIYHSQIVGYVIKRSNTLDVDSVPQIERDYETAKRALIQIEGKEPDESAEIEKDGTTAIKPADEVIYDIFFRSCCRFMRDKTKKDFENLSKSELASDTFENVYNVMKDMAKRYAEKAGQHEAFSQLEKEFAPYERRITEAREDPAIIEEIERMEHKLYFQLEGVFDELEEMRSLKCFGELYPLLIVLNAKYNSFAKKYATMLEALGIDRSEDIASINRAIDRDPTLIFLKWDYQHKDNEIEKAPDIFPA